MKSTQLAQISLTKDHTGATTNPIYLSTAYQHEKLGCSTGFDYTRTKIQLAQTLKMHLPNLKVVNTHLQHQVVWLVSN